MNEYKIKQIDQALKLHINYNSKPSGGKYLNEMDRLAANYPGPKGLALSNMLDDYDKAVGVTNLNEAFKRIKLNNL